MRQTKISLFAGVMLALSSLIGSGCLVPVRRPG